MDNWQLLHRESFDRWHEARNQRYAAEPTHDVDREFVTLATLGQLDDDDDCDTCMAS